MNLFIKVFTLFILLVFSHIAYAQELKDSIGNASYYADKFNGRKTASGEKFDNDKLTAAHRTLPFNTLLLVTNPKNGKEVVVKVNGFGALMGSLASGYLIKNFFTAENGDKMWHEIWLVFAAYALVVAVLFAIMFKHKHDPKAIGEVKH
jgi:hypothetical protein